MKLNDQHQKQAQELLTKHQTVRLHIICNAAGVELQRYHERQLDLAALGKTVRNLRIGAGFIRSAWFAKQIGVSGQWLSMVERGHKAPTVELLAKIINKCEL